MIDLSAYKDIFGAPRTGAHSYRFMGFAIVDTVLTVLAALLLAWFFRWSFVYTLLTLFIVGILLHNLFSVRTTVDGLVFGSKTVIVL
jgi:hypothetical protein